MRGYIQIDRYVYLGEVLGPWEEQVCRHVACVALLLILPHPTVADARHQAEVAQLVVPRLEEDVARLVYTQREKDEIRW